MNRDVLIGAVLVLALLAGFYYFVDIKGSEKDAEQEAAVRRLVSEFDHQLVRAIVIEPAGGPELRVSRAGAEAAWRVDVPQEVEADPEVVRQLLETLGQLSTREDPFPPGEDGLSPYGLAPPRLAVTVTGEGGTELARLQLGAPAPFGAAGYAAVRDTGTVGQVGTAETAAIPDTLFDLREKRLLRFRREEVRELRIGIAEQSPLVIRRQGDNWEIAEPLEFSADRELVGNMLWEVSECRALEFPDDAGATDILSSPTFSIGLTMADGSARLARFGALAEGGDGMLAAGDSGTVMKVDTTLVQSAFRPAERWRELRPFPRYSWEVDGLTVACPGFPPAVFHQDDTGVWLREGDSPESGAVSEETMRGTIDLLTGLEACGLTTISGAGQLEAAGLAIPGVTVTLTSGTDEAAIVESLVLGFPDRGAVPLSGSCSGEEPLICAMRPEGHWIYLINEPGRDELRTVLESLCAGE